MGLDVVVSVDAHDAIASLERLKSGFYDAAVEAERHERAVAGLGAAYARVQAATDGVVSAELAWRTQQELLGARLHVTGEELATLSQAARAYSREHLVDMDTAMQRVTRSLESGGRGLREFGVHLEHGAYGARQAHDAIGQMAERMRAAGVPAQDLGERAEVTGRQFREAFGATALAAVNGLGDAIGGLLTRLTGVEVSLRSITHALEQAANEGQDRANLARSNDELERRRGIIEAIGRSEQALAARGIHGTSAPSTQELGRYSTGQLGRLAFRLANAGTSEDSESAFRDAAGVQAASDTQAATAQAAATATVARDEAGFGRAGGGGGNGAAHIAELQRQYAEVVAGARRAGVELAEVQRATGERTAHFLEREIAAQRGANERFRELADKRLDDEREAADRRFAQERDDRARLAQLLELAQRHRDEVKAATRANEDDYNREQVAQRELRDAGLQLRNVFVQNAQIQGTAAQQLAGSVNGAFGSMTGSVKSHVAALIAGRENIGQALKGILADTLSSVASEAAVKALLFGAKAVADAVTPGMQGFVPGDVTAAALYAGVALAAGGAAFGIGQIGAGGSSGASAGGVPPPSAGSGANGGGPSGGGTGQTIINVNVSGTLFTNEGVTSGVVRAINDARMRGLTPH